MKTFISKLTFHFCATALAMMVLTSCSENEDAGPMVSESRSISNYQEIEVNGNFNVDISEDHGSGIRVVAPSNRMEFIETYVAGNRLIISERSNKIEKDDAVRIEISQTMLNEIELNGSGIISGDEIKASSTTVYMNGSGMIDLSFNVTNMNVEINGSGIIKAFGVTDYLNTTIEGSGSIQARNLESTNADAEIDGSGMIELFVTESLNATISGSGAILYWGNPPYVNVQISGSGNVSGM